MTPHLGVLSRITEVRPNTKRPAIIVSQVVSEDFSILPYVVLPRRQFRPSIQSSYIPDRVWQDAPHGGQLYKRSGSRKVTGSGSHQFQTVVSALNSHWTPP